MYFIYSLLLSLGAIVALPYWLVQALRHGKYLSNLSQRFGLSYPSLEKLPTEGPPAIWIHAVSVGEVLSGAGLARTLKEQFPERPLLVSTTTITGQNLARERIPFADAVFYFPLDWAWCVRRALRAAKPAVIVVLETEIWPNFLRAAGKGNIPVVFVSGRISDRSFARSQKWMKWLGLYLRPLYRRSLGYAAGFLMQSDSDADRVRALGAPAQRVFVSGNLKYDLEPPAPTPLSVWLQGEAKRTGRWPVIVAGSVVATEEPLALIAFGTMQGEFPNALLVLAPRKPERFDAAAKFIHESQRKYVRRSELPVATPSRNGVEGAPAHIPADVTVLLLDSIGELGSLYRCADGVFVGGSLVPSGGHNILEPAAFGKVPVFGPSMENFREIARRFVDAGAAVQVHSPEDAGVAWIELLKDPGKMRRMSEAARSLLENSRGATERAVLMIAGRLEGPGR